MPAKFGFYQMRGEKLTVEADFIKRSYHLAFFELT